MFICNECGISYTKKYSLTRHICKGSSCRKSYTNTQDNETNKEIMELRLSYIEYKTKYEMIERQLEKEREEHKKDKEEHKKDKEDWKDIERILLDKIQNRTTINKGDNTIIIKKITNIYTRTTSELEKIYKDEITPDSIRGGIDNMTKIMVNKTLKNQDGSNMVIVADRSRKIIKYELPSGEKVVDEGCLKIINTHRDIILEQLKDVMKDESISFDEKLDMDSKICIGLFDIKLDLDFYWIWIWIWITRYPNDYEIQHKNIVYVVVKI